MALLTDMDQPLASVAGNALEVAYAVDYLTGARREPRMHEVTMSLCAEMLVLGSLAPDVVAARVRLQDALDSGAAAERFAKMVRALGGPAKLVDRPWDFLERAPVVVDVTAERGGVVRSIDTRGVGLAVVALGGGRTRPQDPVDHAVGLTDLVAVGERVVPGGVVATVHARTDAAAAAAVAQVRAAYTVGGRTPAEQAVVRARITA